MLKKMEVDSITAPTVMKLITPSVVKLTRCLTHFFPHISRKKLGGTLKTGTPGICL